jgi:hypothetical protein
LLIPIAAARNSIPHNIVPPCRSGFLEMGAAWLTCGGSFRRVVADASETQVVFAALWPDG